ncbi:Clp protease (plasmid) [Enterobacteriaceae bacterium Kacie_13]|nr:Clp protease [Enterobacteriaceae bacterium Kacie_13]
MCNSTKRICVQSDVGQLRNIYGGEGSESLAEAVRKSCNVWFPLKPFHSQGEKNDEQ